MKIVKRKELPTKCRKPEKVERNSKGLRDLNTVINPSEDEYLFKTKDGALITLESSRKIISALRENHNTASSKPSTIENKFIGKRAHKKAKATSSKKIVERNELPKKSIKPEKVERNSTRLRDLNAVIKPSDDKYLFKTKDGARITLESTRKIICALRNEFCEGDDTTTSGPPTSDSKPMGKCLNKKNKKTNLNPERKRKRTSGGGSSSKCPRYENVSPYGKEVEMGKIDDKEKLPDPDHPTYTDLLVQNHFITNGPSTICEVSEESDVSNIEKDVFNVVGEKEKPSDSDQSTYTNALVQSWVVANGALAICEKNSTAKSPRYEHNEIKKIDKDVFDVKTGKRKLPDPIHSTYTNALVHSWVVANGALINYETNSPAKRPQYENVEMKEVDKDVFDLKTDEMTLPDYSTYRKPLQDHVVANGSLTICEIDEEADEPEIDKDVFDVNSDEEMLPDLDRSTNTTLPVQKHIVADGASTIREMSEESDESKIDKDVKTDKKEKEKTPQEQDADMIKAAQLLRMLMMGVHFKSVAVFQTPVIWEVDMDSESDNMDMECI